MDKNKKVEEPIKPLSQEEKVPQATTQVKPKEEKKEESRVIVDMARQV